MSASRCTKDQGFTLIELVLYMSLSMIMVILLGGIGVHALESRSKAHAYGEVLYNSEFILETMRTSLDGAASIAVPGGSATSSTLTLLMRDREKSPTVFSVIDHVVWMQVGSGAATPMQLSSNSVEVPVFAFEYVSGEKGPGAVRLTLKVESYNPQKLAAYSADSSLSTTMSLKYAP
jgi:hypothetical protein